MRPLRRAFWLIRIPADLPRFCGYKRSLGGPIISLSLQPLHFGAAERRSTRPPVAKATVTSELFKLSLDLGRTTWFGNLAFGLLVVLILWRENQLPPAAIWWSVLATIVVTRAWYCQRMSRWMSANSNRLPRIGPGVFGADGTRRHRMGSCRLCCCRQPAKSAAVLQLVLTVAVLLGTLLPFAPAGMPWIAFAVPLGFAQLTFLLSRDLPLSEDHARDVGDDADRRCRRLLAAAAGAVEATLRCARVPTARRARRNRRTPNSIAAASNCGWRSTRSMPAWRTPTF